MNDLDLLRDLRRDIPEITAATDQAVRARLREAWADPAPGPARPRLIRRVALAGAIGVTLAAGITAAQTITFPRSQVADAEALGDRAARTVQNQPYDRPDPRQWVVTRTRTAQFKGDMNTWWLGMDRHHLEDNDEWRRVDGHAVATRFADGRLEVMDRSPGCHKHGIATMCAPPDPPWTNPADLPTEPGALLRVFYDFRYPGYTSGQGAGKIVMGAEVGPITGQEVFDRISGVLARPISPRLRAGLFRALPRIPGISVQRDAVDAAGRHGIAFAMSDGREREMIILDPHTFAFLGTYSDAVRDYRRSGDKALVKAGTMLEWTAQLSQRIVDKPGQTS
jgi:hypothetical protein